MLEATTHPIVAIHATHFRSVHPSCTSHTILALHRSTLITTWTSMVLLMSARTMGRPVQLIVSILALDWLTVQILEHAFCNIVGGKLNEPVANRLTF